MKKSKYLLLTIIESCIFVVLFYLIFSFNIEVVFADGNEENQFENQTNNSEIKDDIYEEYDIYGTTVYYINLDVDLSKHPKYKEYRSGFSEYLTENMKEINEWYENTSQRNWKTEKELMQQRNNRIENAIEAFKREFVYIVINDIEPSNYYYLSKAFSKKIRFTYTEGHEEEMIDTIMSGVILSFEVPFRTFEEKSEDEIYINLMDAKSNFENIKNYLDYFYSFVDYEYVISVNISSGAWPIHHKVKKYIEWF